MKPITILSLLLVALVAATSNAQDTVLVWTVGLPGDGWPQGLTGGGPDTVFVQEAGTNPLPGDPMNPVANQQSDDDYYFAGTYTTVLDGGSYDPVGVVDDNEEGAERAFAGSDNTLRYHFNFPADFDMSSALVVQWDVNNLHQDANPDPRYGLEVYFNGNQVAEETLIRPADFGVINRTDPFTLDDVNGQIGEGFDNYVEIRGINYNGDGGGNWMGIDHVSLHQLDDVLPGDFNDDGTVNMDDFNILASNIYGHLDGVGGFANGDMNRDGRIDLADFHDFVGVFPAAAGALSAVPEPSSLMLASFVIVLGLRRSRRVTLGKRKGKEHDSQHCNLHLGLRRAGNSSCVCPVQCGLGRCRR